MLGRSRWMNSWGRLRDRPSSRSVTISLARWNTIAGPVSIPFRNAEYTAPFLKTPWATQARNLATAATFQDDTIYALSSGTGRAGIAVIRISGPACVDVS
jgi:hypothetical protein